MTSQDDTSKPFPRRPPRLARVFSSVEPLYFVTFNTYKRRRILADPAFHNQLIEFCNRADSFGIGVGRYVIMPDHVHLFVVAPPRGRTLSSWMQALKSVLGKRLAEQGIPRPHWQRGFFDHLMRSSESYSEKWEYVRRNPVRAGLCADVQDWPYQGEIQTIAL